VAPSSIPAPLPSWSKWAISLGATPNSYLVQALTYLGQLGSATDPNPGEWRHVHFVWTNNATGDTADDEIITMDIANITGGGLDSSWTDADYTAVDVELVFLMQAWMAHCSPWLHCKELRYYRRAFNPYTDTKPFAVSGPPEHVTPVTGQGSAATGMTPQVAMTHTEKTTYPKHWGRSYWPALAATGNLNGPYIADAVVDAWALSVHNTYEALGAKEFFPCVPTTTALGVPSRNLLGVTAVQVDNIADVIRRRRVHTTTHRSSLPL
jgi:hypothetical protein